MSHRPQNRATDTEREKAFERGEAADAAPDLNRNAQGLTDALNRAGIDRSPADRGVKVHHVQPRGSFPLPALRGFNRVVRVDRGPVHIPLVEADALSGFQVNGWNNQHGDPETDEERERLPGRYSRTKLPKLVRILRPIAWLFSG